MSEEKNAKQEEIEVPKKFKEVVEAIENLSVIDLAELVKVLEKKFGVSAQAPVMVAATPAGGNVSAATEEEKTVFNVELTASGDNKIGVIKAVREFIQLGLKETKDLVDGAPKMVKEGVTKEEAEKIKKSLEAVGATVTLK